MQRRFFQPVLNPYKTTVAAGAASSPPSYSSVSVDSPPSSPVNSVSSLVGEDAPLSSLVSSSSSCSSSSDSDDDITVKARLASESKGATLTTRVRHRRAQKKASSARRAAAWRASFPWIVEEDRKIFCSFCRDHAPPLTCKFKEGATRVNMTRLREHSVSVVHAASVQASKLQIVDAADVDSSHSSFIQSTIARMMRNSYWLAKEMIAMRKFPSINQLCASHNTFDIKTVQYNNHVYSRDFNVTKHMQSIHASNPMHARLHMNQHIYMLTLILCMYAFRCTSVTFSSATWRSRFAYLRLSASPSTRRQTSRLSQQWYVLCDFSTHTTDRRRDS